MWKAHFLIFFLAFQQFCCKKPPGYVNPATKSQRGEFPFIAYLTCTEFGSKIQYECTGSLIRRDFVLTSAHCLANITDCTVKLGIVNVHQKDEYSVTVKSTVLIQHPCYNANDKQNYDLGLIMFPHEVVLNQFVNIIELPKKMNVSVSSGDLFTYAGWGINIERDEPTQDLRYISMHVVPKSKCKADGVVSREVLCVKALDEDIMNCYGDSGGPLVYENRNVHVQIALFSFIFVNRHIIQNGNGSWTQLVKCNRTEPIGFVQIGAHMHWINSVMNGVDFPEEICRVEKYLERQMNES